MINPILVFRVGYMKDYSGPAEIAHGGDWVEKNGRGGEMWNFLDEAGRVYGFVMTKKEGGLNLNKVAKKKKRWRQGDEYDGVDIVFIARSDIGQVVVGWYLNAKVAHKQYWIRPNPAGAKQPRSLSYLCEAPADSAVLLPENKRTFVVPYAPKDRFGPGQSNVWYADVSDPRAKSFVQRLRKYIGTNERTVRTSSDKKGGGKWSKPLSKEKILAIEKASMEATERHFKKQYATEVIARDNRGWDITATHRGNGSNLHLEVKGHLGSAIQFELTPNEYRKMRDMKGTYRICVLRDALKNGNIEVFHPKELADGTWELFDRKNKTKILLTERTGAKASQIS